MAVDIVVNIENIPAAGAGMSQQKRRGPLRIPYFPPSPIADKRGKGKNADLIMKSIVMPGGHQQISEDELEALKAHEKWDDFSAYGVIQVQTPTVEAEQRTNTLADYDDRTAIAMCTQCMDLDFLKESLLHAKSDQLKTAIKTKMSELERIEKAIAGATRV